MMAQKRTWAEWRWPEWVPKRVRTEIENFWLESWGRGPDAWLENAQAAEKRFGLHLGDFVTLPIYGHGLATGRFIHAWNNIGRLISETGETFYVGEERPWELDYQI